MIKYLQRSKASMAESSAALLLSGSWALGFFLKLLGGIAALLQITAVNAANFNDGDLQVHGFLAQAFISSDDYDVYGESTHGSSDFRELGLNVSWQPTSSLLLAAQAVSRTAGATDNGKLKLDYLQLDWRAWNSLSGAAGLRIGKLRLPLGLYNSSRDLLFGRPGIFMPQSIYLDSLGTRELLFASQGAQLYGDYFGERHTLSVLLSGAIKQGLDKDVETAALRQDRPGSVENRWGVGIGLLDEIDGGRWRLSLTWNKHPLEYQPGDDPVVRAGNINFNQYTASLAFDNGRWSATTELARRQVAVRLQTPLGETGDQFVSLGYYLQIGRRLNSEFNVYLRYDELNQDLGDRSGYARAEQTGRPRHYSFARDSVLGFSWLPKRFDGNLGLWVEAHYIDGLETVSVADNPQQLACYQPPPQQAPNCSADRYWSLASVMLAYRF